MQITMEPSALFSLLSDETRLRCLLLLMQEKELCVCEISQILGSIQPKISRHLAQMRSLGLVVDERRGQWVYYRLHRNLPAWVKKIIESTVEGLILLEPYCSDIERIQTLKEANICS